MDLRNIAYNFRKVYLLLVTTLILGSCATTYQETGATGGYSESQLDVNVFEVTFKGNGFTKRDKAADFALLRSAELAIENGYSYFVIIDSNQYTKQSSYTAPSTTTGSATVYGNTVYGSATTYGGQTYQISKPRATNRFVCFDSKPEGVFSYNAQFIVKSLKTKYKLTHYSQPAGTHISSIQKEFGVLLNLEATDSSVLGDEARKSYEKKYMRDESHKAFAQVTDGTWKGAWGSTFDFTTVNSAIEKALEKCEKYNKKSTPCKIVNVNGYWTRDFLSREADKELLAKEKLNSLSKQVTDASPIHKKFGDSLDLTASSPSILGGKGLRSYENEYLNAKSHKAFALSSSGAWVWFDDEPSAAKAIQTTLDFCNKKYTNSSKLCKIINIDGYWTAEYLSREVERENLNLRDSDQEAVATVTPNSATTEDDYLQYYGQAEEEANAGTYDRNLWARALVVVEGDEQKRKFTYIKLRAKQLYEQNK